MKNVIMLIRSIQMGEMAKLGWLIRLVKHAIWADLLYFLYVLLLSVTTYPITLFICMLGKINTCCSCTDIGCPVIEVSPPHLDLRMETDPVSKMMYSLVFRILDDGQSPKTQ
jgi:hypothetical protein